MNEIEQVKRKTERKNHMFSIFANILSVMTSVFLSFDFY